MPHGRSQCARATARGERIVRTSMRSPGFAYSWSLATLTRHSLRPTLRSAARDYGTIEFQSDRRLDLELTQTPADRLEDGSPDRGRRVQELVEHLIAHRHEPTVRFRGRRRRPGTPVEQ